MGPKVPKTITPSLFHEPPIVTPGKSQMGCGGPPEISIFFSLPALSNAMKRLSGDQKGGVVAPSVPRRGRASRESIPRTQRRLTPSEQYRERQANARPAKVPRSQQWFCRAAGFENEIGRAACRERV